MNVRAVFFIAVTLVLSACASPPALQTARPKDQLANGYQLSHSQMLDQTNHMVQHLNDSKDILYVQSFGGGGVGLGLLGPLGVAANVAMIEAATKKDTEQLKNKIMLNPQEVFIDVAKQDGFDVVSAPQSNRAAITPYLYIAKTKDAKLLLASALIVEQNKDGQKWTGKYMYQLPLAYSLDELAQLNATETDRLFNAVAVGYSALLKNIKEESSEKLENEKKITFKSDFMNPRFNFELPGTVISEQADRIWIRTFNGVFSILKENATVMAAKT